MKQARKVFFCIFLMLVSRGIANTSFPEEDWMGTLLRQDVAPEQILGLDSAGIPLVCGATEESGAPGALAQQVPRSGLPAETRGWEAIPGVIRDDGRETFRVEIAVNGPVAGVTIDGISLRLISPQAPPVALRDDGLGSDRLAGDFVFTTGPFRFNTSQVLPAFYEHDPTSPAGLFITDVGEAEIEELDGTITQFLINPRIGLLRADLPATPMVPLSPDIVTSPHLINIRTTFRATQRFLRGLGGNLSTLTNPVYEVLPDEFDFFMFLSTNKLERLPRTARNNFNAGVHSSVQVNYTGTGLGRFDNSAGFGSTGRLLSVNALDAYDRGILSNNATHELSHQWASFTSPALGLSDGTGHYTGRSNVGSLVGGFLWIDNGDGTFSIDCTQGRNGAYNASPLDKYMMGLIDGSEVSPQHVYTETSLPPVSKCQAGEPVSASEIATTVTMAGIQGTHGLRTPAPLDAQRDFTIAFVAESHERFLTPTEMTFYEILAAHYTTAVPPQEPAPYMGFNWVPISRFFGEGTTWRSDIPGPAYDCHGESATRGCTVNELPDQPCIGTSGRDTILGTEGDDVIVGLAGDDIIKGRGGNDLICGGAGNDGIKGNEGNDELDGGPDHDRLEGNKGHDLLRGNTGDDLLKGNDGDDELDGGPGHDRGDGGKGFDTCINGELLKNCEL